MDEWKAYGWHVPKPNIIYEWKFGVTSSKVFIGTTDQILNVFSNCADLWFKEVEI